jgi:hypothetical protein
MDKNALAVRTKEDKMLENKSKRDFKQKRKWKPWNELTYQEKKFLIDKESLKDQIKNVFKLFTKRSLDVTRG